MILMGKFLGILLFNRTSICCVLVHSRLFKSPIQKGENECVAQRGTLERQQAFYISCFSLALNNMNHDRYHFPTLSFSFWSPACDAFFLKHRTVLLQHHRNYYFNLLNSSSSFFCFCTQVKLKECLCHVCSFLPFVRLCSLFSSRSCFELV